MTCFFKDLGYTGCEYRADGLPDRAHLIPAQRLRHNKLTPQVWDSRVYVLACRRHHHLFDNGFLKLTRDQLPHSVIEFAEQHDLEWSIARDYPDNYGGEAA